MFYEAKPSKNHFGIKMSPQTFTDFYGPAFDDFREFHASYSDLLFQKRIWDDTLAEIAKIDPNADIPDPYSYRPDLKLNEDEKLEMMMKGVNWHATGIGPFLNDLSPDKKEDYVKNKIKTWIDALPADDKKTYKGYNHWFEQRSKDVRDSSENLGTMSQYAASGWNPFEGGAKLGMLAGGMVAGLTDPLILSTIPASFMYGSASTFTMTLLRTAAIESVLAGAATTAIESQVVPFKQKVGLDYDWNDASKVILLSMVAGAAFPTAVLGAGKGLKEGYKFTRTKVNQSLAKLSPDLRNKLIGKELDALVKKGMDDKLFLEYFAKNLKNLKPNELQLVVNSLNPNALKSSALEFENNAINQRKENEIENPYPETAGGTYEHIKRQDNALIALSRDQEPTMPAEAGLPIKINPEREVVMHEYLRPDEIQIDATTFQFKTGGDDKGVLDTLKGVKEWRQQSAGIITVWERADGVKFVADGHQRVALAKRLQNEDPTKEIKLTAQVNREVDGFSAADTYIEALVSNLHYGSATASDLASGLRAKPDIINEIVSTVSPHSASWKRTQGLVRLSDDAWGYFLNSKIKENHAATVGLLVDDPQLHLSILRIVEQTNPASAVELRAIIEGALMAGSRNIETIDLFGKSSTKVSLLVERAKVLKNALDKLKRDKKLMSTLVQNELKITESGKNKLNTTYNKSLEEMNENAIYHIEALANRKGPVSDALNNSAQVWSAGDKQRAVETFIESVREAIERGDYERTRAIGGERIEPIEDASRTISNANEPSIVQQKFVEYDPQNLKNARDVADQEIASLEAELLINSKSLESLSGGEPRTSPTLSREYSTQVDKGFDQATGASPSESVFASATAPAALKRIDDVNSIGSFNAILDLPILHHIDNADQLLKLATKYEPYLQSTLNNISENIKKSTVSVRVKDIKSLNDKIDLAMTQNGPAWNSSYISDYLGGRIIVDKLDDVRLVRQAFEEQDIKIIAKEDYFIKPKDTGYVALHFNLLTKEGFSMEIQVQHKDMAVAFGNGKAYRKYKGKINLTKEQRIDRQKLQAADKIVFENTYSQIKEREGFIDDVGNEMITSPYDEMIIDGNVVNSQKTVREFMDEVKQDETALNRLKDCI